MLSSLTGQWSVVTCAWGCTLERRFMVEVSEELWAKPGKREEEGGVDGKGNLKNFCSLMEGGAGQGESHRLNEPVGPADLHRTRRSSICSGWKLGRASTETPHLKSKGPVCPPTLPPQLPPRTLLKPRTPCSLGTMGPIRTKSPFRRGPCPHTRHIL